MDVKGVEVKFVNFEGSEEEAGRYVDYVQSRIKAPLRKLIVELCADGKVDVHYYGDGEKFERIRRITGYLVGTIDRWNNAKQAEERERVKHDRRQNEGTISGQGY